jgi:hypothetical protein
VANRFPSKLYKYVPAARIDILQNARVRFTPPAVFNDPFEMLPVLLRAYFASEAHKLDDAPRDFARDKRRAEGIRGAIGVLSLTEKPCNLLMWSHYADQHRGFVIEFDASHPFFQPRGSPRDEFHHVRRVEYTRQRPSTPIESFVGPRTLLTKSVEWRYEREWRMLARVPHRAGEVHLVALPPSCITGIILGARMPEETRDELCALVTSDPRYAHVTVRDAVLDPQEFKLAFQKGERYFERARKVLEEVREGATEDPTAPLEAAVAHLDRALRYDPDSVACLVLRAGIHGMLGNFEAAVSDYGRAVKKAPRTARPDLYILRARFLVALERTAEAEEDLKRCRRILKSLPGQTASHPGTSTSPRRTPGTPRARRARQGAPSAARRAGRGSRW